MTNLLIAFISMIAALIAGIFVVLKISGEVNWSWVWIFSPIWGTALLAVVMFLAAVFIYWVKGE